MTLWNPLLKMKKGDYEVTQLAKKKREKIDELIKVKESIETQCTKFGSIADKMSLTIDTINSALSLPISVESVEEVDKLLEHTAKYEEDIAIHGEAYDEAQNIHKSVSEANENPEIYSFLSLDQLKKKINNCKEKIKEKLKHIQDEKKVQEKNEKLLKNYHDSSNTYIDWHGKTIKELTSEQSGEIEKQREVLAKLGDNTFKKI